MLIPFDNTERHNSFPPLGIAAQGLFDNFTFSLWPSKLFVFKNISLIRMSRLPVNLLLCKNILLAGAYLIFVFRTGFHITATIAAIAGKHIQQSLRWCGNHISAIVAITAFHNDCWRVVSIWLQRLLNVFSSGNDLMETSLYLNHASPTTEKRTAWFP